MTWAVAHTPATVCPCNGRVLCSLVVGTHTQPYHGAGRWAYALSLSLPTTGSSACSAVLLPTVCLSFCSTLQQAFAEHLLCVGRGGSTGRTSSTFLPSGAQHVLPQSLSAGPVWTHLLGFRTLQTLRCPMCVSDSLRHSHQSTCRLLNASTPSRHHGAAAKR